MDSLNSTSLLFLLVGKENPWLPFLLLGLLVFQKWDTICEKVKNTTYLGKSVLRLQTVTYFNSGTQTTAGDISPSLRGFLHSIQSLMAPNKQTNCTEFRIPYEEHQNIFIPAHNTTLQITTSITAHFDINYTFVNSNNREGYTTTMSEMRRTHLTITLVSTQGMSELHEYVHKCIREYDAHVMKEATKQCYIVKPSLEKDKYEEIYKPVRIPFHTTKTFDTLFFPEKERLLHRLDMLKNPEFYGRLGLPQSLGILLYGEPGTGKTSTIKAIASYMRKNIILVPMNKIKTRQDLENIFYNYSCTSTRAEDRMYVFEEIDCNGWGPILLDRRQSQGFDALSDAGSDDKDDSIDKLAEVIIAGSNKSTQELHEKKKRQENDRLTLGCILEIMDGIVESPGRIIVMTTNRRHMLDPALTRPGRIDIEIEFKKLRASDIGAIYEKWYGSSLTESEILGIRECSFTQAEISQLLFDHEKDPAGFYKKIGTLDTESTENSCK